MQNAINKTAKVVVGYFILSNLSDLCSILSKRNTICRHRVNCWNRDDFLLAEFHADIMSTGSKWFNFPNLVYMISWLRQADWRAAKIEMFRPNKAGCLGKQADMNIDLLQISISLRNYSGNNMTWRADVGVKWRRVHIGLGSKPAKYNYYYILRSKLNRNFWENIKYK
jgi:hypothetical protein